MQCRQDLALRGNSSGSYNSDSEYNTSQLGYASRVYTTSYNMQSLQTDKTETAIQQTGKLADTVVGIGVEDPCFCFSAGG